MESHNARAWKYIRNYANNNFTGYPGYIIGAGGMDSPDSWEFNADDHGFFTTTEDYASKCEDENAFSGRNVPFFCYLEHQGHGEYNSSWVWEPEYIKRYCGIMSLPSYNWYPCMPNTATWMNIDDVTADRCATANIFPEDGPYFESYADRDEIITFYNNAGAISVDVFEVQSILTDNGVVFDNVYSGTVPDLSWSDELEISSSGSLSGDCGDRNISADHNLNGAVAIWEKGCSPGAIQILYYDDDSQIQFGHLFEQQLNDKTELLVLGQDDYVANNSFSADGMICQDEMRILCCYEDINGCNAVRIYEKRSELGADFGIVDDLDIVNFQPAFGVWGYFWRCGGHWPYYRSGFVLCNEDASQWRVIHRTDDTLEHWIVERVEVPFDSIENLDLNDLDVYRYPFYTPNYFNMLPSFASHNDYLVGAFSVNDIHNPTRFELRVSCGTEHENAHYEFFPVEKYYSTLNCNTTIDHISDLAIESNYSAATSTNRVYCNYYDSPGSDIPNGILRTPNWFNLLSNNSELVAVSTNYLISQNCSFRVVPTRRSMTNALLSDVSDGMPRMMNAGDPGGYHPFLYPMLNVGIRLEHDYGVVQNEEPTCLMTTVQAFGRSMFGQRGYCPSLDEIMYISVSPIIHGVRALIYYNLQGALEASYGGLANRLPLEMTCWNLSRDPENPAMDLVSTVHNAVSILSGIPYGINTNEVNFLSAIVDDYWECIPGYGSPSPHQAYLVNGTWDYVSDDNLNFLAFRNASEDEVLVLVAVDDSDPVTDRWIRFSGLDADLYDVECVYSADTWVFNCLNTSPGVTSSVSIQQHNEDTRSRVPMSSDIQSSLEQECSRSILLVDLCGLPKFSCALFRIYPKSTRNTDSGCIESLLNINSLQVQNTCCGPVEAQVFVADGQEFSIFLFDLSGRVVSKETGCGSTSFTYSTESYNHGVYFVMLEVGDEIETEKILLLN